MNSLIQRETALILQFPPPSARARLGRISQANVKQKNAGFEMATSVCAGAWYHEAAVAETDRARKP